MQDEEEVGFMASNDEDTEEGDGFIDLPEDDMDFGIDNDDDDPENSFH